MNANALAAFFLLLLALPASAGEALIARKKLFTDQDPEYASAFLKDDSKQAAAKAEDSAVFPALFQAALELKDLDDILSSQFETSPLRQALEKCHSSLCSHPKELMEWRKRYRTGVDEGRLSEAVLEWPKLTASEKAFAAAKGDDENKWKTLLLADRKALVEAWGKERLAAFMKLSPKTSAELEAMRVEASAIHDAVDHDDAVVLWDRYRQAEAGVHALADAAARVKKSGDPVLKAKLEQARSQGNLDAMLDGLNHLFDGTTDANGSVSKELKAAAPAAPSQGFDEGQKQLLSAMLAKSFLAEMDGTWAGNDLIPFYKKHELKLSISPLGGGRIAEYRDWSGDIVLNQSFVDEYVRANGLTPARLLSQAGALNGLTVQLSPLFVHEAWHQVQGDFARGLNAPDMVSQNWELESMQVEALYVLQKLKYDPKFKKIMEAAQDGSKPAREAISKAQRLEKGAAYYRNTIVTWHYPGVQSLEGWAGKALNDDRYFADKIRAELKRREELPVWTRMSLSGAKPFSSSHLSADQWSKELPEVGSKTLETILATYDASLAKTPQVYEAYERRLTDLNRATEARVAELKAGGGAPPKKAEPVPAPAGARK